MEKWSEYRDDICPHCNEHTGFYASYYRCNMAILDCPHCDKTSLSGFDFGKQIFRWFAEWDTKIIIKKEDET